MVVTIQARLNNPDGIPISVSINNDNNTTEMDKL